MTLSKRRRRPVCARNIKKGVDTYLAEKLKIISLGGLNEIGKKRDGFGSMAKT